MYFFKEGEPMKPGGIWIINRLRCLFKGHALVKDKTRPGKYRYCIRCGEQYVMLRKRRKK